jgi:putative MATE family efflux protein
VHSNSELRAGLARRRPAAQLHKYIIINSKKQATGDDKDSTGRLHDNDMTRQMQCVFVLLVAATQSTLGFSSFNGRSGPSKFPKWRKFLSSADRNSESGDSDMASTRRYLNRDFLAIAVPAFLQQASTPLADVVSSTFLHQLPPRELGGVGVARSSHAAVSKLFTAPLAKTTMSLVASKYGASMHNVDETSDQKCCNDLIAAVSTSLWLAWIVGVLQSLFFFTFASRILNGMGIGVESDMYHSATAFLKARALGTPAITMWIVMTAIMRALNDAVSPLKCSVLLNAVNWILAPVCIVSLGMGASGAAISSATAQYIALVPLTILLRRRLKFRYFLTSWNDLFLSLREYLKASLYLLGQTVARVATFTYFSRQSALLGSVGASAYSVLFQIGFSITLVCEAISVATQTLLSRESAKRSSSEKEHMAVCTHLVQLSLILGIISSLLLSLAVYLGKLHLISLFARDAEVQNAALQALPAFLLAQIVKGLAFSSNGILMGGMDWRGSMLSMWAANVVSITAFQWTSGPTTVTKLWLSWTIFLSTQAFFGLGRYISRTGEWKRLRRNQRLEG